MGRHGAEFIRQGGGGGKQPPQQEELKVEFARAISAWADSPKIRQKITNGYRMVHVTPWADFWRQWLADIQATKEQ